MARAQVDLTVRRRWPELARAMSPWLATQRWFAGKARAGTTWRVVEVVEHRGEAVVADVLLEARYDDAGPAEVYQVPLVPLREGDASAVVATVGGQALGDALDHAGAARVLARAAVVGSAPDLADVRVRRLAVEQSNSSVVLAERWILKVFRRLEDGPNPDVELTAALTEAGSAHVPAQVGALRTPNQATTLAVLSAYVSGGRDAWELACADAGRVAGGGRDDGWLVSEVAGLGGVLAGLHRQLRAAFGGGVADSDEASSWVFAARARAEDVLATGARVAPERTAGVRARREDVLAACAAASQVADIGVQRLHGDLHLGQVLWHRDLGWQVLDWEGEPARPLDERRRPTTPLRDVAGMLRSFDYAAAHAVGGGAVPAPLVAWRDRLRGAFWDGYLTAEESADLLPAGAAERRAMLVFAELDKALYELGYELANRPTWVAIPVAGILGLLAGRDDPDDDAHERGTDDVTQVPHPAEVAALLRGEHTDPHHLLGPHDQADGAVVRAFRPDATAVQVLVDGGEPIDAVRVDPGGLFQARLPSRPDPGGYRLRVTYGERSFDLHDPYAFPPTVGDVDLHLYAEGRHHELWRILGAHERTLDGVTGTGFAVWAPHAAGVRVVGDHNSWDGRLHPLRKLSDLGVWEVFVPGVGSGNRYKYELVTADGHLVTRADPLAAWAEVPPDTASRVFTSRHTWSDDDWLTRRRATPPMHAPMSIYEVHLGSWRHQPDGGHLSYREAAHQLAEHVTRLGFTHVELLPVAEHPFGGSWGYQVTGYYAPTARFGNPDDLRYLVDHLHQAGVGVIVDWVPAHFPKDAFALARFDGTALYEAADPHRGEHPEWGTLIFDFGRDEVRGFLIANALYWIEELHVDGLRVDAVASMLYLDYARDAGAWTPNVHGGRENLEAVSFLSELNTVVYGRNPDAMVIAEESTAWPGVTRPVHVGGLGFGLKWNMGWMHDTLDYFTRDPIHRSYHHGQLTFGLMYAWSEHYVLPLSHDEVVHGKASLLGKMPGDRWQAMANLRTLYGWMWAHPGKKLVFMGGEIGQLREWSEARELDWHLRDQADHAGLERLVADLNAAYRAQPALWARDDDPSAFGWIDANANDANFFAFLRRGTDDASTVVCLANCSPLPASDLRVGLPHAGGWRELLNTDAEIYGGSNVGNLGRIQATTVGWHGQPASAEVTLPPLGVLWLVPDAESDI